MYCNADVVFWLNLQSQPVDEVATLRKELKDTLMMYDRACENLAHAKEKVSNLRENTIWLGNMSCLSIRYNTFLFTFQISSFLKG